MRDYYVVPNGAPVRYAKDARPDPRPRLLKRGLRQPNLKRKGLEEAARRAKGPEARLKNKDLPLNKIRTRCCRSLFSFTTTYLIRRFISLFIQCFHPRF